MILIVYKILIFIAGFIDSIAGGGGLIALPTITLLVGPGPQAIGTNKIIAVSAALSAFINYARKGHFRFKLAAPFFLATFIGTFLGSRLAFLVPPNYYRYALIVACPFLLYIVLNKKSLIHPPSESHFLISMRKLIFAGLFCGLYDGSFGPGAGTIMLISLVTFARLPLMIALACSKFANAISASTALASFALGGVVHWKVGIPLMLFAFVGALLGSHLANEQSEKIVKPVLILVVCGLLVKLLFSAS